MSMCVHMHKFMQVHVYLDKIIRPVKNVLCINAVIIVINIYRFVCSPTFCCCILLIFNLFFLVLSAYLSVSVCLYRFLLFICASICLSLNRSVCLFVHYTLHVFLIAIYRTRFSSSISTFLDRPFSFFISYENRSDISFMLVC